VPVREGWNIISNPFDATVSWQEVQDFNNIPIEALILSYARTFQENENFEPTAGYYFFNDPEWNLEELQIPYSPEDSRFEGQLKNKSSEERLGGKRSEPEAIVLSAALQDRNGKQVISKATFDYNRQAINSRHPGLDMALFGIALSEGDSDKRSSMYFSLAGIYDERGSQYSMRVKGPVGETLLLSSEATGLGDEAGILLVNPVTNKSYLLRNFEETELAITEPDIEYTVYTGDIGYLEDIKGNLLPDEFALEQNYPNPFNPTTNIRYSLAEEGDVRLDVYDILGRRVQTLVQGQQTQGWHVAQFDGSRLASGVYLYRLTASGQVLTGKMMLIK